MTAAEPDHFDVLIVGAGLSGIGAAAHLQRGCPGKSYAILEARDAMGGTWDLFRYPGIRSDSDMYTLGYAFKPWTSAKAIADGPAIRAYVEETARERGIDRQIRFGHRVIAADWSSGESVWRIIARTENGETELRCRFLVMAAGYYDYDEAYRPHWPGEGAFAGPIVHPQFWPPDLDFAGKRIAVIGSGATAVTLVPALARAAAHVAMVQRTPSYIVSRPSVDAIAEWLKRRLGQGAAYRLTRWKNVALSWFFFRLARARPSRSSWRGGMSAKGSSKRTSRRRTSPGTSASAWCPTATCSRRCATDARRWSPARSSASPQPACGWPTARRSRPTSSLPPRA
jgi:monooxygenase